MNLAATLEQRAAARGFAARPALRAGRGTVSHAEVHEGGARASSLLAQQGVGRGDRVLLALPDGVELAWAFLGAVRLGAVAVPVNPQLPADDHRLLAADCRPAAVVCPAGLADRFTGAAVLVDGVLASSVAGLEGHPAAAVGPADAAYAQYTSGTTGAPRAAVHRHGDPLVYEAAFSRPVLGLDAGDVVLSVSKMFFAYGLGNSLLYPLLCGACAVLLPGRPLPRDVVALVGEHRVTVLFAVPTFYANLLRLGPAPGPLSSLRLAVSAGERLPTALAERTADLLGCPVVDSLGCTEVGQAFVSERPERARPGTLGRALPPYEVAVRDEAGTDQPPGEIGALEVRGPTVLLGYLGPGPAATLDDGWLRTGDLASMDEDGFVSHHGRADDLEMVGGISVAPQEIEEVLSRHPRVSEVAVAAVADGWGATRLQAFVLPAGGGGDDRLAVDLIGLAQRHLAAHKVPRAVTFVDALPRTPTGKLRRFLLRSGAPAPAPAP